MRERKRERKREREREREYGMYMYIPGSSVESVCVADSVRLSQLVKRVS